MYHLYVSHIFTPSAAPRPARPSGRAPEQTHRPAPAAQRPGRRPWEDHGKTMGLVISNQKMVISNRWFWPRPSYEAFLEMDQKFNQSADGGVFFLWEGFTPNTASWRMNICEYNHGNSWWFLGRLTSSPLLKRLRKKTELYIVVTCYTMLYPLMPITSY